MEALSQRTVFRNRGAVIVIGHIRRVGPFPVGTIHESEGSSSVRHEQVGGDVILQHPLQVAVETFRAAAILGLAPVVKPAHPEFSVDAGRLALVLFQIGKGALGSAAEVHGGNNSRQRAVVDHPVIRTIRGKGHHARELLLDHLQVLFHVILVRTVGTVFVFYLGHDNGAALGDLQGFQHGADFFEISHGRFQKAGVLGTYLQVFILEQPSGEAAKFPFGTHIGTGTHDNPQSRFLGLLDKLYKIPVPGKIPFARFRFMHVPEQIGTNSIHAHGLHALEPVLPVGTRHARIVHLSGNDLHGLAVHQEIFLIGGEDVLGAVIGLRHGHGSGHTQMGGQQQNGKKG